METIVKSITKSQYASFVQKGIEYDQYKVNMAADLALNKNSNIQEYINLNQFRMSRIEKTYAVSDKVKQQASSLHHKIYWLILAEHWCGDAAQSLPVFQKVASLSSNNIEMKLVYRDENLGLMDAHLTGESRSIPKLIQLDKNFNVTGVWGPRPTEAQKLVMELKSNPATAANYSTELHKWYAHDKQRSLESEISQLLSRASLFCVDCFN